MTVPLSTLKLVLHVQHQYGVVGWLFWVVFVLPQLGQTRPFGQILDSNRLRAVSASGNISNNSLMDSPSLKDLPGPVLLSFTLYFKCLEYIRMCLWFYIYVICLLNAIIPKIRGKSNYAPTRDTIAVGAPTP